MTPGEYIEPPAFIGPVHPGWCSRCQQIGRFIRQPKGDTYPIYNCCGVTFQLITDEEYTADQEALRDD